MLQEISKHIRMAHLKARPRLTGEQPATASSQSAYAFACALYETDAVPSLAAEKGPESPLASVFDDLTKLSLLCGKALVGEESDVAALRETLTQSLVLMRKMAQQLQNSGESPITIPWSPDEWLNTIVQCIKREVLVSLACSSHNPTMTALDDSVFGPGQCGLHHDNLA